VKDVQEAIDAAGGCDATGMQKGAQRALRSPVI
jgi:hypothetical protein